MSKYKTKLKLKKEKLEEQNGLCAFCERGRYCPDCEDGNPHKLNEDGSIKHRWQQVNTMDHNHDHVHCLGCAECIRGIVHNMCNWNVIPVLQRNPHLQNEKVKLYLERGKK